MAEKLTPQQEMAVHNRGGKLLVSAAAGSGKTKVLVDRLLSFVLDENNPADLDEFLIITYTKAAAAELRGKIAAKLSEKMAQSPENRHLQRQMQRLYLTKISTVHAFCGDILREYAYRLDIAPDFRVADENECRQLREMAMNHILEQAYENIDADPDFREFVDTQGLGRNDRLIPEIVEKVYDSARCHLNPEQWLDACVKNAQAEMLCDAGQTVWGKYLIEDLHRYLALQIQALSHCARQAAVTVGMDKVAALLQSTVVQLEDICHSQTWDGIVSKRQIDYGRLTFPKNCEDPDLAERIKAVRDACKKGVEKKLKSFSNDNRQILADLKRSSGAVRGMTQLAQSFGAEYDRLKRIRRVLDFGDLEHKMLDLVVGRRREQPTALAHEIGKRYREIMVDEYQDSNAVQDAIFSALSSVKQNCFMVGDVKQSIYQFRLADPSIFLEKYETYVPAEEAKPGQGRKVVLSANFRSGGGVLAGVNDVFRECMSPAVGGLHYGEEESLNEGIPHVPLDQPEVELLALQVQESTYEEESALVAQQISQLLDGKHYVRQGDTLRPIQPEDIAILLRSPGSVGIHFQNALQARGIRCVSGGGEDLLQTREIGVLRSMLQIISNPRQDIPLLAVLTSPLFCFTADDLAVFRGGNRKCSVYDALCASCMPKAKAFLQTLEQLRKKARLNTLAELLEEIFLATAMDDVFAAMDGGGVRAANLQTFYTLAVDFETGSRRDLSEFLDFLDSMEERGLITAAQQTAAGAVTLMSIHKSKGLEFPVVFVCGLSREFNRESARAQVLCDKELGLGLTAVDEINRVRYPTIAKRAIAAKIVSDSLSEEMRVLYVALTRARDRLIMTYSSGNLPKDIQQLAGRMDMGSAELLTMDAVCPGDWVMQAALRRTEAGELFALGGRPERTSMGQPAWNIKVVEAPDGVGSGRIRKENQAISAENVGDILKESLAFRYAHQGATMAPSKQTATQRKGRAKDAEAAEDTRAPVVRRSWRSPSFRQKQTDATARGNATHSCMQYIRYENCDSLAAVEKELDYLVNRGSLTQQQREMIDTRAIAAFFQSQLGEKLRFGKEVLREFKFSILDDAQAYSPELAEEKILLQGVVDCALIEDDGIVLLDFKTDYVTEETVMQRTDLYRQQVLTYAGALQRIFRKKVKASYLYFFTMDKLVSVE